MFWIPVFTGMTNHDGRSDFIQWPAKKFVCDVTPQLVVLPTLTTDTVTVRILQHFLIKYPIVSVDTIVDQVYIRVTV
jgi:hypothetical protein